MLKKLSAILFCPWIILGVGVMVQKWDDLQSVAMLAATHLFFLALFWLIIKRAKSKADKQVLGYSADIWLVTPFVAYVFGLCIPLLA